jgi:hypothetical protein
MHNTESTIQLITSSAIAAIVGCDDSSEINLLAFSLFFSKSLVDSPVVDQDINVSLTKVDSLILVAKNFPEYVSDILKHWDLMDFQSGPNVSGEEVLSEINNFSAVRNQ